MLECVGSVGKPATRQFETQSDRQSQAVNLQFAQTIQIKAILNIRAKNKDKDK